MKGKRLKDVADPNLARIHEKGARVVPTLSALDKRWGRYHFTHGYKWYMLLEKTEENYKEAVKSLVKARELDVWTEHNFRFLGEDLRDEIFFSAGEYLTNFYLTLAYFATELLWLLNNNHSHRKVSISINDDADVSEKLKQVIKIVSSKVVMSEAIHQSLERRDAFTHPTFQRIFPTNPDVNWKENHIAWALSGDLENTYSELENFIKDLYSDFERFLQDNPTGPITFNIERGIKAQESYKKPLKAQS
jgi:hypothetical protein